MKDRKDRFEWKGELKFVGTADEFNELAATLNQLPVEFIIPEWEDRPRHFDGCTPFPVEVLLGQDRLKKFTEKMPTININYIQDIRGGMRTPHLHWGDKVVLLDRTQFVRYVADMAHELGERRAETIEDYIEVMDAVGRLAPM